MSEILDRSCCPYCLGKGEPLGLAGHVCRMCDGDGTWKTALSKFPKRCYEDDCSTMIHDPDHEYCHHTMTGH